MSELQSVISHRFPKNSRVVFIGDSITHANIYLSHVVDYYNRHFPHDNINFYNNGISGSVSFVHVSTFDLNVVPLKPTHAVILLGTNDSGRELLGGEHTAETYDILYTRFKQYQENIDILCKRCAAIGAQIILCTPTPFNEYADGAEKLPGSHALIQAYGNFIKGYAKEHGYGCCDYYGHMTRASMTKNLFVADRVHPNEQGYIEMAKCFLAFQGLEPDEFDEFPENLKSWNSYVQQYRDLRATELMIIGGFNLPLDEAFARVDKYFKSDGRMDYFDRLANDYLKNKPREKEIIDAMLYEMEIRLKTSN